jgi:hypothetical protein
VPRSRPFSRTEAQGRSGPENVSAKEGLWEGARFRQNRHQKNLKVIELSRKERTLQIEPNDPSQDKRLE